MYHYIRYPIVCHVNSDVTYEEGIQPLSYSVSWKESLPQRAVRVHGDGHSSTTVRCSPTVIMPYQISVGHSRRAQVIVYNHRASTI